MHLKIRIAIFIDGSNLYHSLRHLLGLAQPLIRFDYRLLADSCFSSDHVVVSRAYYIGVPRANDPESFRIINYQRRLFQHLRSSEQCFTIREGKLRRIAGVHQEKGVDVLLTIDLITMALKNQFDTAILISSDSDLVPAVEFVRANGKRITYIAFEGRRTIALSKKASKTLVFNKASLSRFLPNS